MEGAPDADEEKFTVIDGFVAGHIDDDHILDEGVPTEAALSCVLTEDEGFEAVEDAGGVHVAFDVDLFIVPFLNDFGSDAGGSFFDDGFHFGEGIEAFSFIAFGDFCGVVVSVKGSSGAEEEEGEKGSCEGDFSPAVDSVGAFDADEGDGSENQSDQTDGEEGDARQATDCGQSKDEGDGGKEGDGAEIEFV